MFVEQWRFVILKPRYWKSGQRGRREFLGLSELLPALFSLLMLLHVEYLGTCLSRGLVSFPLFFYPVSLAVELQSTIYVILLPELWFCSKMSDLIPPLHFKESALSQASPFRDSTYSTTSFTHLILQRRLEPFLWPVFVLVNSPGCYSDCSLMETLFNYLKESDLSWLSFLLSLSRPWLR